MGRYLKAAFLVGVPVPGLGRLPVNAMAAFAFAVLGFVEPSLWLVGAGLQTAVVSALAFNARFQTLVDARSAAPRLQDAAAKSASLVASLPTELKARLDAVEKNAARVLTIYRTFSLDRELSAGTESSLDKLRWIYLKLLVARNHLVNELGLESRASLESRIAAIRTQAQPQSSGQPAAEPAALLPSQQATIAILERRIENLANRDRLLRENESDLCRIEAQIDLMRENAAIEGKPAAVGTEIALASDLATPDLFGAHANLVRDLDAAHSLPG
jgi:hypothetical protein